MDLSQLNKNQKAAVTQPIDHRVVKEILVLAGAGSGKTKVLANRIAYLVEHNVPGSAILAITFTKKAAQEMQERVSKMVPNGTKMKLSTYHSLAVDILKAFQTRPFTILDDHDQRKMLQRILVELKKDDNVSHLYADFEMKKYLAWLNNVRCNCKDPRVSKSKDGQEETEVIQAYRKLSQIYYIQKGEQFYDFDDLIEKTVEMLHHSPSAMQAIHQRWKYILVDEYQDTNERQFEFVSLICGKDTQLLKVGDEDQLIYSWRGARIEHILGAYQLSLNDPMTKCVMLTDNYRCSSNILELANEVVSVNQERAGKTLKATLASGKPVGLKLFASDYEEADFIAMQITQWRQQGYQYGDVAILLRTNSMAMPLERALAQRRVPYKVYNGASLFDRIEVRLISNLLMMSQHPEQSLYFTQVADEVKLGAGPATLTKWEFERAIAKQNWPEYLASIDLSKGRLSGPIIRCMIQAWEQASKLIKDGYLSAAAAVWLREFPFYQLYKEDERERRAESVLTFLQLIEVYEEDCRQKAISASMTGFQEQRLLNDSVVDPNEEGKVHILTVHKAKGLEFPVGVIPGLQDGVFPKSSDSPDGIEEDVRLAYVAITRFKKELVLTRAAQRIRVGDLPTSSVIVDPHVSSLMKAGKFTYIK